jgi:hypothetical protein
VEGETEVTVLTEAAHVMNYDLVASGVRCVEFAQTDPVMFIKVANDLGIPCHYMLDGDTKGEEYRTRVVPFLPGGPEADYITKIAHDNTEHLLCESGFGDLYLKCVSPARMAQITVAADHPQYWRQVLAAAAGRHFSKPRLAADVVAAMRGAPPKPVPPALKEILDKALGLARR